MNPITNTPSLSYELADVKEKMNIVEIIRNFYPELKKDGRHYTMKCPEHGEKTASFTVDPNRGKHGYFKCFGCPVCGSPIDFVMLELKLTFADAVNWIGDFYRLTPKENNYKPSAIKHVRRQQVQPPPLPIHYIDVSVVDTSMTRYHLNNFVCYLQTIFNDKVVKEIIQRYNIGTSKKWHGACSFWQQDINGNFRTGHIMLYNPSTGKRSRLKEHERGWNHTEMKLFNENIKQCFFGEHLLRERPLAPVGVLESEKSCCIASAYIPEYVWIASCGLSGINREKCKALEGRDVTLFPDLSKIADWHKKADEISDLVNSIEVSELLEINSTEDERLAGYDLADYLLKVPYSKALKQRFKDEFLKDKPLPINVQYDVWREYHDRGLDPKDAKDVTIDLMQNHGFIKNTSIEIPSILRDSEAA